MSVSLSNLELNELGKPYGTDFQLWLAYLKQHSKGLNLPSSEQLRQHYQRGKTVSEVLALAKRYRPLSV